MQFSSAGFARENRYKLQVTRKVKQQACLTGGFQSANYKMRAITSGKRCEVTYKRKAVEECCYG